MIKRHLASVSALALLVGFATAPFTHLHPTGQGVANDSLHTHGHPVLHSHATSHEADHEHDAPADDEPRDGHGLYVNAFVFAPVKTDALANPVVVLSTAILPTRMASIWTSISPQPSPGYTPPSILPPSSRAPPILPLRAI